MFQNKPITHITFKAYRLSLSFKCGSCQTKSYAARQNVTYFWLKNPSSVTKILKIGSVNSSVVTGLRMQIVKYASQA